MENFDRTMRPPSIARAGLRSGRFAAEEWETWMKWDGALESLSPNSPPSLQFTSDSMASGSELEGVSALRFSPVYELPPAPIFLNEAKKRKSSSLIDGGTGTGRQPRGKKVSHNVIEKRYRSNLNDKIAKLRDSVPTLRSALVCAKRTSSKAKASDTEGSGDDDDNSAGLKFNKATVLTKATEYIQQLEKQQQRLLTENALLRNRLRNTGRPSASSSSVDMASNDADGESSTTSEVPEFEVKSEENATGSTESSQPVLGMLELPEAFRRLREEAVQAPSYAPPSRSELHPPDELVLEDDKGGNSWPRSRLASRLLIGSLAGLMVIEGFVEQEQDSEEPSTRGLFALPKSLLTESRGFREPISRRMLSLAASSRAQMALPVLKISIVVLIFLGVFFTYIAWPDDQLSMKRRTNRSSDSDRGSPSPHRGRLPWRHRSLSRPTTSSDSKEDTLGWKGFFARHAILVMQSAGLSWLAERRKDEETGSPSLRAVDWRRRWTTYSQLLPKLLNGGDGA